MILTIVSFPDSILMHSWFFLFGGILVDGHQLVSIPLPRFTGIDFIMR